jgi:PAS domain-containing protein
VTLNSLGILLFVIEPPHSFGFPNREAAAGLALFVVVGSLISLLVDRLRDSLLSTARAEAGLRKASERRGLAFDAAKLGAWDYRFDSVDVLWDERCRKIFGVTTNMRFTDTIARIHADDRATVEEAVKQALRGNNGGAYDREFRVVWPDNSVHGWRHTGGSSSKSPLNAAALSASWESTRKLPSESTPKNVCGRLGN